MKVRIRLSILFLLFFATIISLTSCAKRRELRELGCARGRVYIGTPVYTIGPKTKKEFFEYLDAPIMREGSLDTPVPMNADLEINFLPNKRFKEKLIRLIKY